MDLTSSPSSLIQNGVKTRNGNGNGIHHDNDPGSSGSSTSTLTGQRGPIPLTIKQLGIISHKMSLITIFGHKNFRQKFHQKYDIFHEKISTASDFGLYLE